MTKRCTKCGVEKPLDEFYPHAKSSDGHKSACKMCEQLYQRKRYERERYERRFFWTPERRELLKSLYLSGKNYDEIRDIMGLQNRGKNTVFNAIKRYTLAHERAKRICRKPPPHPPPTLRPIPPDLPLSVADREALDSADPLPAGHPITVLKGFHHAVH